MFLNPRKVKAEGENLNNIEVFINPSIILLLERKDSSSPFKVTYNASSQLAGVPSRDKIRN
jgi:hypothetical protein